jgi:hypothetical protein
LALAREEAIFGAMNEGRTGCAVCGAAPTGSAGLSRVIIQGRALWLCLDHATTVAVAMPETFEQMRALFAVPAAQAAGAHSKTDRRSPIDRRRRDDRRVFPPRSEGRRMAYGRRATDPVD